MISSARSGERSFAGLFRQSGLPRHGVLRSAAWAFLLLPALASAQTPSIARTWNEELLAAIRIDKPNPPVHARNLFHTAVSMYDAWVAYDTVGIGYLHHERRTAGDVAAARRETISYAAYRILKSRFATSANAATTSAALDNRLIALGYNASVTTTTGDTPAALGNRIAATILAWGDGDGSNQAGAYVDPLYTNSQPAMVVLRNGVPQGGVPSLTDPTRWQPLAFDVALTQNGLAADKIQQYIGATWLKTLPFALQRTDPAKPWIDPGGPSKLKSAADAVCKAEVLSLLRASSQLNSQELIDISPGLGGQGDNPLGEGTGDGYPLNPATGLPYAPNPVKLGDFARVLAEYWADGPTSETPPGHWHVIANQISDHSSSPKRIGGVGPVVDTLEWDVKTYFALSAATHDAASAAWSLKRYYEGPRPITLVRFMGAKGQSSNPGGPSYHADGLLLEPGVVEVVTSATAATGGRHFGVGSVGDVVVYSWPGEPADPLTQQSGVRWMRARDWLPYQRKTFNTPAFPGFVSGHSTFSRAAAEVLAAITGSAFFPDGLGRFTANANSYLVFERGPSQTVQLQWATYFDAADQAGQSRRWGGIHVAEDDRVGRIVGAECGKRVWALAQKYFDCSVATEVFGATLTPTGDGEAVLAWPAMRGMYYHVQSSADLTTWTTIHTLRATDTSGSHPVPISAPRTFYRVVRLPSP